MNTRINELVGTKYEQTAYSDLYTRYKVAFDKLLALEDIREPFGPGGLVYLPDEQFESELNGIFTDIEDTVSVVIGFPGVGKSTTLRYVFNYESPGASFYDHNGVKALIFAAHYNGHVNSDIMEDGARAKLALRDDLQQRIESVCSYIEEFYPVLWSRFTSELGKEEFYKYLKKTNRQVLQHLSYEDMMTLAPSERRDKELALAFEKERFTYMATKLKYYMGCKEFPEDRLVVILDDIEPLSFELQKELVMQYNKFLKCMLNGDESIAEKPFTVNLIISMRPYTYCLLNKVQEMTAFTKRRRIFRRNHINFGKLLEKKISYYTDEIPKENSESFENACIVLRRLMDKFDYQYSEMVKNLTNWNIRDSVNIFRDILKNRNWIQRNMERTASFSIDEGHYVFNNITVLRTISCGSKFYYRESDENLIPNLLQNARGGDSYCFVLLSLFALFKPYDVQGYSYTNDPETIGNIKKTYFEIFPKMEGLDKKIDFAISYLYRKKVLLHGIDNKNYDELRDDTLLQFSPKGYELARMIRNDSVYMEVCREAIYRDYSSDYRCSQSSYELMRQGKQYKIFKDLLVLQGELLDEEEFYIRFAEEVGSLSRYITAFGGLVSGMFLIGIEKSIKYSGYIGDDRVYPLKREIEQRIQELSERLDERKKHNDP